MPFTSTNQPTNRRPNLSYAEAEALRDLWAAVMAEASRRSGYTPAQLVGMASGTFARVLRDEGLPTRADLARSYGISAPLLSTLLRRRAYAFPHPEIVARRGDGLRRWQARRRAGQPAAQH